MPPRTQRWPTFRAAPRLEPSAHESTAAYLHLLIAARRLICRRLHLWWLQIVEYHKPRLTPLPKDSSVFRIGWIARHHKRRIKNFDDVVAQVRLAWLLLALASADVPAQEHTSLFAALWCLGAEAGLRKTSGFTAPLSSKQICLLLLCLRIASAVVLLLERLKQGFTDVAPLLQCNTWQAPPDSGFSRVECWPMDFDDPDKYLENMSQLQSLNVLVSTLGPAFACLRFDLLLRLATSLFIRDVGARSTPVSACTGLQLWLPCLLIAPAWNPACRCSVKTRCLKGVPPAADRHARCWLDQPQLHEAQLSLCGDCALHVWGPLARQ